MCFLVCRHTGNGRLYSTHINNCFNMVFYRAFKLIVCGRCRQIIAGSVFNKAKRNSGCFAGGALAIAAGVWAKILQKHNGILICIRILVFFIKVYPPVLSICLVIVQKCNLVFFYIMPGQAGRVIMLIICFKQPIGVVNKRIFHIGVSSRQCILFCSINRGRVVYRKAPVFFKKRVAIAIITLVFRLAVGIPFQIVFRRVKSVFPFIRYFIFIIVKRNGHVCFVWVKGRNCCKHGAILQPYQGR